MMTISLRRLSSWKALLLSLLAFSFLLTQTSCDTSKRAQQLKVDQEREQQMQLQTWQGGSCLPVVR